MKKERPEFDQLNRLESSIAEILRQNYPQGNDSYLTSQWLDIAEALEAMLKADKPRFDSETFWMHCFGDEIRWGTTGS